MKITFKGLLEIFERKAGDSEWELIRTQPNLITNVGYNVIANSLTGQSTYALTDFEYFAWGDGTTTPALTDTAATFYADCANSDTKGVTSFDAYDVPNKKQIWNCFLSAADNAVASITKFALMNDDPGTIMFNEIKFDAISKDATKEFFIRYSLVMSQV